MYVTVYLTGYIYLDEKMGSNPIQSLLLSAHNYPLVVVLVQRWLISAYQFIVFTRS